jgi:hypothetical protein
MPSTVMEMVNDHVNQKCNILSLHKATLQASGIVTERSGGNMDSGRARDVAIKQDTGRRI